MTVRKGILLTVFVCILVLGTTAAFAEDGMLKIEKAEARPEAGWQKKAVYPDAWGYVDDTLAMNSMVSFQGYHGQGYFYLEVAEGVTDFTLYVNGRQCMAEIGPGVYRVDYSAAALDGKNTLQIGNIRPADLKAAVTAYIPYPVVLPGSIGESGIRPEALQLISDLIRSDIDLGFTSAQLAVVRNGRMVYENAWGTVNAYEPDGVRKTDSPAVTVDTLYDLASVTKMFSMNYALQKLVTDGQLDIDARIVDILGSGFAEDTAGIRYAGCDYPGLEVMKQWKAELTVRDILCHQAGFPADVHYHSRRFDMEKLSEMPDGENILYAGSDGSAETRQNTLKAIFKTPLMYEPGTKTVYSDLDYMLLGFIAEKITGRRLDEYVRDSFYTPMGLTHVTYNPLKNGFSPDDCAATELNGNTRDRLISYPGIREYTLQGEVHDEKAWYAMGGVSGHAGLFSNASDLAKLASVMLTGGYGENRFFSRNVMDMFTAPKALSHGQWGLGWWREGDDQRPWYFGTQSASNTFGHQGWTGTLVMVDPSRQLVIVYLTNKINSPVTSPDNPNRFNGGSYTASTLGFVAQLLSMGMDEEEDITPQLTALLADMANGSVRLADGAAAGHPLVLNAKSKISVLRAWAKDEPEWLEAADEAEAWLP